MEVVADWELSALNAELLKPVSHLRPLLAGSWSVSADAELTRAPKLK
jgi:hypothetical protein